MTLRDIVEKHAWALYEPDSTVTDAHMAIEDACREVLQEMALELEEDGWIEAARALHRHDGGVPALLDDAPASESDTVSREPGCECHLEAGDSPCRVHGDDDHPVPASEPQPAPGDQWRALLEAEREMWRAVVSNGGDCGVRERALARCDVLTDMLARGPR